MSTSWRLHYLIQHISRSTDLNTVRSEQEDIVANAFTPNCVQVSTTAHEPA